MVDFVASFSHSGLHYRLLVLLRVYHKFLDPRLFLQSRPRTAATSAQRRRLYHCAHRTVAAMLLSRFSYSIILKCRPVAG